MKKLRNAGRVAFGAAVLSLIVFVSEAQVGIGTTLPQAKLHVADGAILGTSAVIDSTESPYYGSDYADSLRYFVKWDHQKSALVSFGARFNSGYFEPQAIDWGKFSVSSGFESWASGVGAAAFGLRTTATGRGAVAFGEYANATGPYSLAIGYSALANGGHSVALGENVSNAGFNGSFVFGFGNNQQLKNTASFQMTMGFSGGYRLFTNSTATVGVQIVPGGNSWSVISDVNKKENFAPVNGEDFLQKISKMNLTSWNYKGQDPKTLRHYGPMAQDFYAAFGKDEYGTIGSDTTINQADFDGVNLIAVQALIRRMEEMSAEIATIKAQLAVAQSEQGRKKKRILVAQK